MSARLQLENFIFYRAACLKEKIIAAGGRLYCSSPDPYLSVGIYLYNSLFSQSNRKYIEVGVKYQLSDFGGIKSGWILPSPLNKLDKK